MARKNNQFKYLGTVIVVVLGGVLSWAFYNLIYSGAGDGLAHFFGITNTYIQNIVVIITIILIFMMLGYGGKKIIKKLTKG